MGCGHTVERRLGLTVFKPERGNRLGGIALGKYCIYCASCMNSGVYHSNEAFTMQVTRETPWNILSPLPLDVLRVGKLSEDQLELWMDRLDGFL